MMGMAAMTIARLFAFLGMVLAGFLSPLARADTMHSGGRVLANGRPAAMVPGLDLVARAVEGAESSYGADKRMWQLDWRGPQGPMQVSQAAAFDVGGGDRFNPVDNRDLGRAYLAQMFRRYNNWENAVIAYNWGPRNLDQWLAAGRPPDGLSVPIKSYLSRVMREAQSLALGRPLIANLPASQALSSSAVPPPPVPALRNPALRRAFERDQAAIRELQEFLDATNPAASEAEARAGEPRVPTAGTPPERDRRNGVLAVIRQAAARPGYEEFRTLPAAKSVVPAALSAYRQIALVLIGKLQSECAALVLVDQRRAEIR
jgi:hypothetical protein